ncbi:MAG TPA: haloacid dehalogenase type II [Stellaceae bacterium]|nr:haloacid dehalogenase type II [Stellaceae bacterium]
MSSGIKACVFDAYGTLFDVHSAVARHAAAIGPGAEAMSRSWRLKQLEYTWIRSLMHRHADFWAVTGEALDFAMASAGLADPALRERLMDAYLMLDAYPEVPSVLDRLKAAGIRSAILSNGSPRMLDAAVRSARLEDRLEAVFSIEEVGIYKPDPRVYRLAVDRLGLSPAEISFQSSNVWDAAGAAAFGFHVVWINRSRQPPEYGWVLRAREIASLDALPEIVAPA